MPLPPSCAGAALVCLFLLASGCEKRECLDCFADGSVDANGRTDARPDAPADQAPDRFPADLGTDAVDASVGPWPCPSEDFDGPAFCSSWSVAAAVVAPGVTKDGGSYALQGGHLRHTFAAGCADGWCGKSFEAPVNYTGGFSAEARVEVAGAGAADAYEWGLYVYAGTKVIAHASLWDEDAAKGPVKRTSCDGAVTSSTALAAAYAGTETLQIIRDGANTLQLAWGGQVLASCSYSGTISKVAIQVRRSGSSGFPTKLWSDHLHLSGTAPVAWKKVPSPETVTFQGVWSASASDVFVVGYSGKILRYDGSAFKPMIGGSGFQMYVWGSDPGNVISVGESGLIARYDGKAWSTMSAPTFAHLYGVWGSGPKDIFVTGGSTPGVILHYDGSAWTSMTLPPGTPQMMAVWGSSASDVFAVGEFGTVMRYDGKSWSKLWTSPSKMALRAVWGTSGANVYAVDHAAAIHHYNGTTWTTTSSGSASWLTDIWGSSDKDIFVSGRDGVIVHYDGATWSPMISGVKVHLWSVCGSGAGDVWMVGSQGTILHYGP